MIKEKSISSRIINSLNDRNLSRLATFSKILTAIEFSPKTPVSEITKALVPAKAGGVYGVDHDQ